MSINSQNIALTLSAEGLRKSDVFSKSDPYAALYFQGMNGTWHIAGRTKTISNNQNPNWLDEIVVEYRFEERQRVLIKIYDDDYGKKADDFLGEANFELSTLMGARGQKIRLPLLKEKSNSKAKGALVVRATQITGGDNELIFKLRARQLAVKDWLPFGLGSSDPYFVIAKPGMDAGEYVDVLKSEVIKKNLNPVWQEQRIPLRRLGIKPLRLEVSDQDNDGSHDLIGYATITIDDLLSKRQSIPIVHPPTKPKYTKAEYKCSGYVDVVSAEVKRSFGFTDYIAGGCQIQLVLAVDFTGSNGDPNIPNTLHYGGGSSYAADNPYLKAIKGVASILIEYDYDKKIPAYGFGARPSPGLPVSFCFPMNYNQNPEVNGLNGIIEAYQSVFQHGVVLSGPTNFAEVIRTSTRIANSSRLGSSYTVLLLLTDGAVSDLQATIDALGDASKSPLSVIIVGVGNGDFTAMKMLDADTNPLVTSRGSVITRDLVQFVAFNEVSNDGTALARETLMELPQQLVSFFTERKISPGVPVEIADSDALFLGEREITTSFRVATASIVEPPRGATTTITTTTTIPSRAAPSAPPLISRSSLGDSGRNLYKTAF
jgi:hypothetical protein